MSMPTPGDPTLSDDSSAQPSGTEESRDPALVAEWARRGRAVLIHTLALGAFLIALRVQKIWLQEFDVGFFPYLQALSAEILLLLLLEAPWFLTIRIAPQKTR